MCGCAPPLAALPNDTSHSSYSYQVLGTTKLFFIAPRPPLCMKNGGLKNLKG